MKKEPEICGLVDTNSYIAGVGFYACHFVRGHSGKCAISPRQTTAPPAQEPEEKPDWAGFMEKPLTEAEKEMIPQRELPPTDAQKQMEHDAGLIGVLFDDKKNLRTERDNWRRKYFEMERAQSRSIDQNGEHKESE
jgi:hypothetical protein